LGRRHLIHARLAKAKRIELVGSGTDVAICAVSVASISAGPTDVAM
jgi:hypothetical protein